MKKRFIVLIDFSDHSERLLTFSYNWAIQAGAELVLVHHIVDPIPGLGDAEVLSGMRRDKETETIVRLKSFAERIVGLDPAVKYYTDSYNVPSAVMKLQEQNTTDYVFVGMNNKTGAERFMVSSTALRLAEQVDRIIIALPTRATDFNFDNLYVGIKRSYRLNEARFEELLSIKSDKIRHVTFFSVLKKNENRDEIASYLKNICGKYEKTVHVSNHIIEANNTSLAIKQYLQENEGVLVVQKGPRSFLDIFRKFFTTEIVHHAQIPVIILP